MTNFTDMLSKAKAMQDKMKEVQEQIKKIEVEGEAGGNLVKVILTGDYELKSITIADAAKKEDQEIINDLIKAAYNHAKENLKKRSAEELSKATGGLNLPADFKNFSRGDVLGIPNLFLCVIGVMIPTYIILNHTRLGNHLYSIGSNRPGAELNAVPVTRTIFFAYMYSSLLASIVGILVAARLSLGIASNGFTWELQAVASSVIGGTSLFGAVGGVFGPVLGATVLSTINNGANLLNVQPYWQRILTGVIIVAVVFFDQLKKRGK